MLSAAPSESWEAATNGAYTHADKASGSNIFFMNIYTKMFNKVFLILEL
ncbi:hypothetical protein l13_10270 [Neisseria weaveri ATCC 51223]|nr:hypothetical protein l13_10270 [Neisseria weaveri ATCC 51223]